MALIFPLGMTTTAKTAPGRTGESDIIRSYVSQFSISVTSEKDSDGWILFPHPSPIPYFQDVLKSVNFSREKIHTWIDWINSMTPLRSRSHFNDWTRGRSCKWGDPPTPICTERWTFQANFIAETTTHGATKARHCTLNPWFHCPSPLARITGFRK